MAYCYKSKNLPTFYSDKALQEMYMRLRKSHVWNKRHHLQRQQLGCYAILPGAKLIK